MGDEPKRLLIGLSFLQKILQIGRPIVEQPEHPVDDIDQWRGPLCPNAELLKFSSLLEIAYPKLAALFLDQRRARASQPVLAIYLYALWIAEDIHIASFDTGFTVGEPPQDVEPSDRVHHADGGAAHPKYLVQHHVEHHALHIPKVAFGGNRLAIAIFHSGKARIGG